VSLAAFLALLPFLGLLAGADAGAALAAVPAAHADVETAELVERRFSLLLALLGLNAAR
jgi:hypothetical protein